MKTVGHEFGARISSCDCGERFPLMPLFDIHMRPFLSLKLKSGNRAAGAFTSMAALKWSVIASTARRASQRSIIATVAEAATAKTTIEVENPESVASIGLARIRRRRWRV